MSLVDIVGNTETVNLLWDSVITVQWNRFYEKVVNVYRDFLTEILCVYDQNIIFFWER